MSIRLIAALGLLALTGPAFAVNVKGNYAAGQEKARTCAACHGETGNESTDGQYPKLAGQHPEYLVKALQDYRSGARPNAIMAGFAGTLSDQDMRDLAVFYARQSGELHDLSATSKR